MSAGFTPGPWLKMGGTVYSSFFTRGHERTKWQCAIYGDLDCPREELQGNAHLIAAAPKLYALLEECLEKLPLHEKTLFGTSGLINRIGEELKKARGEA